MKEQKDIRTLERERHALELEKAEIAKTPETKITDDQLNRLSEVNDELRKVNVDLDREIKKENFILAKAEAGEGVLLNGEGGHDDFNINTGKEADKGLSLGDWMRVIATKKTKNEAERKALSSGTPSEGGYTIPTILRDQIIPGLFNYSSFIQAGGTIRDLESEPAGNKFEEAKVATNVAGAWYAESAQISDNDPAFTTISPTFTKYAVNVTVPNELLQDMVVGGQFLENHLLRVASEAIDSAALAGSGSSNEPTGIINQSGVNVVSLGSGDGAAFADYSKIIDAKEAILTNKGNRDSLSVIHHPRTMADLSNLQASDNQPLIKPSFLNDVNELISQALPIDGTVGSGTALSTSILGNFSDAVASIRLNPNVFIDPYRRSDYDQTVFRLTMRMAVTLRYPESFTKIRYIAAA